MTLSVSLHAQNTPTETSISALYGAPNSDTIVLTIKQKGPYVHDRELTIFCDAAFLSTLRDQITAHIGAEPIAAPEPAPAVDEPWDF